MRGFFGGGFFIQTEKVDDVAVLDRHSEEKYREAKSMAIVGGAIRFQVPLAFNKFIVAPFAEARLGLTNLMSMTGENRTDRFYFGIGGGAYAAYRVTDSFAPMVGVQYMHSNYSVFFKDIAERSNSVLIFAGIKLIER